MTFATFSSLFRLPEKDAEMIFDRDEPIGAPTDLVLPRKRWFRRRALGNAPSEQEKRAKPQTTAAALETLRK